jgi:hypothetical protein
VPNGFWHTLRDAALREIKAAYLAGQTATVTTPPCPPITDITATECPACNSVNKCAPLTPHDKTSDVSGLCVHPWHWPYDHRTLTGYAPDYDAMRGSLSLGKPGNKCTHKHAVYMATDYVWRCAGFAANGRVLHSLFGAADKPPANDTRLYRFDLQLPDPKIRNSHIPNANSGTTIARLAYRFAPKAHEATHETPQRRQ